MKKLSKGFSTGTCLIASIKQAVLLYFQHKKIEDLTVDVLLPDNNYYSIAINKQEIFEDKIVVSVIKNAGDDPDVTHNSKIEISLQKSTYATEKDYIINSKKLNIILTVNSGVGFVTRNGLNAEKGKWAINNGPREILALNLNDIAHIAKKETFLVSITVINGAQIAKKTLNPSLGVINGISILGNSGFVEPHSNKAYLESIKICIKSLKLEQNNIVNLCTGVKTENFAKCAFDKLSDSSFIRIGDFIAETLKTAGEYNFNQVNIFCMPGKLFKYYCGYENTHAHNVKLDIKKITPVLEASNICDLCKILECKTISEILSLLTAKEKELVLSKLEVGAMENLKKWINNKETKCSIFIVD